MLIEQEIKKIKTDLLKSVLGNEKFENKREIKEKLDYYRNLFAIKDEKQKLFFNQMITDASTIPNGFLKDEKKEEKNTKSINKHQAPSWCEECGRTLYLKYHNNEGYSAFCFNTACKNHGKIIEERF